MAKAGPAPGVNTKAASTKPKAANVNVRMKITFSLAPPLGALHAGAELGRNYGGSARVWSSPREEFAILILSKFVKIFSLVCRKESAPSPDGHPA